MTRSPPIDPQPPERRGPRRSDPAPGAARADGVLRVALATPLRRTFDYLPPADAARVARGARVRVPFGRATRVGIVLETGADASVERSKLRRAHAVLDDPPLLPPASLELLEWAGAYFRHPIGEVVLGSLPPALRAGRDPRAAPERRARLTAAGLAAGDETLARAPRQRALAARLREHPGGLPEAALAGEGRGWREALRALEDKGLAERFAPATPPPVPTASAPTPNDDQRAAIDAVAAAFGGFAAFLLDGVTGSGKTEVYLALIERLAARGEQALVLIPEIGLTPQIVERFRARLALPVAVMHSDVPDGERAAAWMRARDGDAAVVIGTRSAVFAPLARPGLVIVDEEHDLSYKQQDGFRYSARDVAIWRARAEGVPVVLGSATPSLESLHNAERGRYRRLVLPERAGSARPPAVEVLDVRARPFRAGLSEPLLDAVRECVARGEQALLFVNRRGYAPARICHACGWVAECARCDARLVWHRDDARLRCHHCGHERPAEPACPECGGEDLRSLGTGTERVVEALAERLPAARVDRMDRDSTRRRGALEAVLARVHGGETDVLVGTQMLAKGHHFPNVTLVGILDADGGLFGADFRAPERMAQLLVQVAGRAGRGDRGGRVLVQTHHPEHPLLRTLVRDGYAGFCAAALAERREAALPPLASMAILRAEAARREPASAFLDAARAAAAGADPAGVGVVGPMPAPMERRAGRYRAQLVLESPRRGDLQRFLARWVPALETLPEARRARWSLDVDPQEIL